MWKALSQVSFDFSFVCKTWQDSYLFHSKFSPLYLPNMGEKIYYRKDNFLAMSNKQKETKGFGVALTIFFSEMFQLVSTHRFHDKCSFT